MMVVYVVNQVFVRIIHVFNKNQNNHVIHKKHVQGMGYVVKIDKDNEIMIFLSRFVLQKIYVFVIHHGKEKIVQYMI